MKRHVKHRRYASRVRDNQAQATHRTILDAARKLFVARGFQATTVREIAAEGGVAEPTVYGTFGDKSSIVWALLDDVLAGGGGSASLAESEFVQALLAEPNPRERLRMAVSWGTGDLFERGIAETLEVIFQAAAVDEAFEDFARMTLTRRHENSQMLTESIPAVPAPRSP